MKDPEVMTSDLHSSVNAKEIIFVIFIILFAGIVRIPSLTQPLGPDQGIIHIPR